ncbi:MAG: DMT family transporter [Acidimicrobiaceae bacterium]|nr:DMT family transporter [Acidimicrobiaceae bacterium]
MSHVGVVRCLLAAVLFGASAPAASNLAGDMPALMLAGLLYVGAGLAVVPSVARTPPTAVALKRDWRPALVAVIAGGAIGPALLVAGLARAAAATASILLNLELAATVLLAATVFREHIGRRVLVGAALVTVAGAVLTWEPGAELSIGALLIAGACLAWGLDNGVTAKIDQLSPEQVVLLKGFMAGFANLALGFAFADSATNVSAAQVLASLAIGAAGYGASIVLWVKGARDLGAARGQVIFAAAPFIGAVIAWSALGESVTVAQLFAVAIAAAGVGVSLESAHHHSHAHEAMEHEHEHSHEDGHHDHQHDEPVAGRHTHVHQHEPIEHSHPHVPDLHHRHRHRHRRGRRGRGT